MNTHPAWLNKAVFYEIYPQSFYDSNGDGIGDISGITQKLEYLRSLGVDAIWLNPCFTSPFQDAGYDVSDYYNVAPRYGSNEDLKHLFEAANQFKIKILLDLVPGHTSIEHPWFQQSSKHARNPYSDWFIWTDSAWKWEVPGYRVICGMAERDSSFIANFFYFQPALNYGFANPDPAHPWQQPIDAPGPQAVRAEIRKIMKFWLDMGASGFRVDMAGWLVKGDPGSRGTIQFWQEMRAWLDQHYPDACLISEWGNPRLSIQAGFHADFCLPFGTPGYTSLLRKPYGPGAGSDPYGESFFSASGHGNIREFVDDYLAHYKITKEKGVIILPTGNHDINPRLGRNRSEDDLKLIYTFLMTMPGAPIIYYGDEIGMNTLDGLPSKEGGYNRTGSRTPMQWNEEANAGFSTAPAASLYLPIDPNDNRPTVEEQDSRPASLLNHIRKMIRLRKNYPAFLANSDFEIIHAQSFGYPFVYLRKTETQSILIAINPSSAKAGCPLKIKFKSASCIDGPSDALQIYENEWILNLPGVSAGIYLLEDFEE